jgi:hypothetical protein
VDSEAWARAEPQKTEESGEKAEIFLRGIISGGNPPYLELCCVSLQLPYHGTGQLSQSLQLSREWQCQCLQQYGQYIVSLRYIDTIRKFLYFIDIIFDSFILANNDMGRTYRDILP